MKPAEYTETEWRALDAGARVRYACWNDNAFLRLIDPAEVTDANDRALLLKFMPEAAGSIDLGGFSDSVLTAIVAAQPSLLVRVDPARIPALDWAYLNRVRPNLVEKLERPARAASAVKAAVIAVFAALSAPLFALSRA